MEFHDKLLLMCSQIQSRYNRVVQAKITTYFPFKEQRVHIYFSKHFQNGTKYLACSHIYTISTLCSYHKRRCPLVQPPMLPNVQALFSVESDQLSLHFHTRLKLPRSSRPI